MKTAHHLMIVILLLASCTSDKEKVASVGLTEVGILVDAEGKITSNKLLRAGTYRLKDTSLNVVVLRQFRQPNLLISFRTKDNRQFNGFLAVSCIMDTTSAFKMYSSYGPHYYEINYEPLIGDIFRTTASNFNADSLKQNSEYLVFMDSLSSRLARELPQDFYNIAEVRLDSVTETTKNPFN
jgi:hypothetical protein